MKFYLRKCLEDIKKMADFVTKPVNQDGIAYALKQLRMI